jgi:hypothetical protein
MLPRIIAKRPPDVRGFRPDFLNYFMGNNLLVLQNVAVLKSGLMKSRTNNCIHYVASNGTDHLLVMKCDV